MAKAPPPSNPDFMLVPPSPPPVKTGAWNAKKVESFKKNFMKFLNYVKIDSKETGGGTVLGKSIYNAQRMFLDAVWDGLSNDIHDFKTLKSRQLGISTISMPLVMFWLGMHDGMQGAMIFDTGPHMAATRRLFKRILEELPLDLGFPHITHDNREGLGISNGSFCHFLSAGVRSSRSAGVLGRSSGLNLIWACLAPHTHILIGDGVSIPVEQATPGMSVLTHTGASTKIVAVGSKHNTERMVKIYARLVEPMALTWNHKIVTSRGEILAGELQKGDKLVMPIRNISHDIKGVWLHNDGMMGRNRSSISTGGKAWIETDKEFGFFSGYYLAKGSMKFYDRPDNDPWSPSAIEFVSRLDEQKHVDRIWTRMGQYTSGTRTPVTIKSGSCLERLAGVSLANLMNVIFGSAKDKVIPDAVFRFGVEFCAGLLEGLLCGSTNIHQRGSNGLNTNTIILSSVCSSLAFQVRDLAVSLGYGYGNLRCIKGGEKYGRVRSDLWTIAWKGDLAADLMEFIGITVLSKRSGTKPSATIDRTAGAVYLTVQRVMEDEPAELVYDVQVEHSDHTFRTLHYCVGNSEMCSWENDEGIVSLKSSIAQEYPNRLYLWESTARGQNMWYDMWNDAKSDDLNQKATFIGWWAKESQRIQKGTPAFNRYGLQEISEKERERINEVKDRYGVEIDDEQLAWIRRMANPSAEFGADESGADFEADELLQQDQPWTEDEAFVLSGSTFFPGSHLNNFIKCTVSQEFQAYYYMPGSDFTKCIITKSRNKKTDHLKIWREPDPDGVYVVSADPAGGHDENNDRSACQVMRCYADMIEQVAEYACSTITTNHFAWVIMSLLGYYKNARLILEINGPGEAVWNELKMLRQILTQGYLKSEAREKGLLDMFHNIRQYMYVRSDALTPGTGVYHWKTQANTKVGLMERLRDFTGNNSMILRSRDCIDEMRDVVREGDKISAPNNRRDDRVIALAMSIRCWEQMERRALIAQGKTFDAETAKRRLTFTDQYHMISKHHIDTMLKRKAQLRTAQNTQAIRNQWRNR